ncbi:hypothetical protein BPOR_0224g00020 [Botrytis porri]|uniref:Uncharacterized protein n=1 Tax=Botrytis porri TaxID=87229 RepID=A0A4Z1KTF3_9HELO|nr:hypothetical protein BPOR_0224g00020 [Botrytis porri]
MAMKIQRNALETSEICKQEQKWGESLLQTEGAWASVALDVTNGGWNHSEIAVGEQVDSSLVASDRNRLGNEEVKTGIFAGGPEGAGGIAAGAAPLWDVWESSVGVAGDESGAFDTDFFHASGLDHGQGVADRGEEGGILQALAAVWDAGGAEVRDLEEVVALFDGGSRCKSNGDGGDDSG